MPQLFEVLVEALFELLHAMVCPFDLDRVQGRIIRLVLLPPHYLIIRPDYLIEELELNFHIDVDLGFISSVDFFTDELEDLVYKQEGSR